jgi:hypothetical protein
MAHRTSRPTWLSAGLTLIALIGVSLGVEILGDGGGADPSGSARAMSEPSDPATPDRSPLPSSNRPGSTHAEGLTLSPSPPAPTPAPSLEPVTAELGPDCQAPPGDSLGRARDLMNGRLVLSRHKVAELPKDPMWSEDPFDDRNWEFQYHTLRFTLDLIDAWRTRLGRMYLLQVHCGSKFPAVEAELLACLADPAHRSQAKVYFCLGRRTV